MALLTLVLGQSGICVPVVLLQKPRVGLSGASSFYFNAKKTPVHADAAP
jgi:hypothetical protein